MTEVYFQRLRQAIPYLLIYRRRIGGDFLVVAVAHTSRRPGFWRGRH